MQLRLLVCFVCVFPFPQLQRSRFLVLPAIFFCLVCVCLAWPERGNGCLCVLVANPETESQLPFPVFVSQKYFFVLANTDGFLQWKRHLFVAMCFCWINPCFFFHSSLFSPVILIFFVPHIWAWQILVAVCRFFSVRLFTPKFRLIPMVCFILRSLMWQRDSTGAREGLLDGCGKLHSLQASYFTHAAFLSMLLKNIGIALPSGLGDFVPAWRDLSGVFGIYCWAGG